MSDQQVVFRYAIFYFTFQKFSEWKIFPKSSKRRETAGDPEICFPNASVKQFEEAPSDVRF